MDEAIRRRIRARLTAGTLPRDLPPFGQRGVSTALVKPGRGQACAACDEGDADFSYRYPDPGPPTPPGVRRALERGAAALVSPSASSPVEAATAERSVTTPRALVVEDNPAVRDLWCDALSLSGYDVAPARDGLEALARFDAAVYDLVLTDLLMPGMSGWQLAETIRTRRTTPVVLVSGSASEEDLAVAQAQGMILLQKPVHLADLRRVVEQALHAS
jgi:CheY-like chemotaxis protein